MSKPFIVVDGQVYLNAALVADAAIVGKVDDMQDHIKALEADVLSLASDAGSASSAIQGLGAAVAELSETVGALSDRVLLSGNRALSI